MLCLHFLLGVAVFILCISAAFAQEDCSLSGSLRLLPTVTITASANNSGRVEICLPVSQSNPQLVWGTIYSAGNWGEKNGQVACRELGFDGVLNSIITNTIPILDRNFNPTVVHLENVVCDGTESTITGCSSQTCCLDPGRSDSGISDAFIVCRPRLSDSSYSVLHTGGPVAGDIRLVGDQRNGAGIVEIFDILLGWVTICPDFAWNSANVNGLCDQLGYDSGTPLTYNQISEFDVAQRRFYDADCSPGSSDFTRRRVGVCSYQESLPSSSQCTVSAGIFAGIRCSTSSTVSDGDVRLVGGADVAQGIVEVLLDGRWGVICGDNWGSFDSDFNDRLVCERLEYDPDDASYISSSSLLDEESSLKPLWLHGVDCSSVATSLLSCAMEFPRGFASCRTAGLAAVDCGDPPTSGLASGAITGIVFAVFVIVFFVLPFGWVFGKGYWEKRHESDCYNTLTNPSDWCDCDCTRTTATWHPPRRTDPPPSTTHTTITTAVTTNTAAGSSSEDSQDETSSNYVPPFATTTTQPTAPPHAAASNPEGASGGGALTKAAPPTYDDASSYKTPKPDDLPPPYPGGVHGVAAFAYPPPTSGGGVGFQGYPAPTSGAGFQGYPAPSNQQTPSAPPPVPYPVSTTLDPAYPPPPSSSSPLSGEPALPYPVEIATADPAYPPPAVQVASAPPAQTTPYPPNEATPYQTSDQATPYPADEATPFQATPYPPEP